MHGHNVQPGLGRALGGQKLKFTRHLSNDRLLFERLTWPDADFTEYLCYPFEHLVFFWYY